MDKSFERIDPKDIKENPIKLFGDDWAIVAAGKEDNFNELTVSWGALGDAWWDNMPIAIIFVSATRYTQQYLESNDTFSINIFPVEYRKALAYIGSHSGRNEDKVKATGLKVEFTENITPVFPEARLILECRKIYSHNLDKSRFSESLIGNYAQKKIQGVVPHTVYFGEILNCWKKNHRV